MKVSLGKKILWVLIVAATPFISKAQEATQTPLQLTLDKAIEIALSDNPIIKVAEKEIQRVDYSKKSAWYNVLPSLNASGQYAKFLTPMSTSFAGMVIPLPTDFNASASLSLGLPLFAPALWRTIQMTTLDMQLAVEKAHASKITLRNDVSKAYYGVLLAQDSYKTLQGGYALAEDVYQQAKKRFEVGLSSEFDVISAEVQMKNLQPSLMEVENGIEQAKMYLKILMGLEITQPIEISGNLINYESSIENSNAFSNFSLDANTDLKQLEIQQRQLQKALSLQRTQRMPTLAAFGSYTYAGTGNKAGLNFITQQPSPASQAWFSQGLLAGLQLSVPLTGIFTNIAKEKQTKVQITQLAIQRDYLEESLNLQVRTALNNMDKALKQAEAAKSNEDLAQKGYDISMKRYDTGMGTILELQSASLALTQAQLARRQAIATYLNSKADLVKTLGTE
ncbi:MAG: TolC family protein [Dysgonamonadaceae bacterium]|jgi:outer membrane protein TolC|nr:TolC family protein [Dysgonamonadaceae bacterium]